MSLNVKTDPVMEAMAKKLFSIESVPVAEKEKMIRRAINAGREAMVRDLVWRRRCVYFNGSLYTLLDKGGHQTKVLELRNNFAKDGDEFFVDVVKVRGG